MLNNSNSGDQDKLRKIINKSRKNTKKTAPNHSVTRTNNVSEILFKGRKLESEGNYQEAKQVYKFAADLGSLEGYYLLGGVVGVTDPRSAYKYYFKAAEGLHFPSLEQVALMDLLGHGVNPKGSILGLTTAVQCIYLAYQQRPEVVSSTYNHVKKTAGSMFDTLLDIDPVFSINTPAERMIKSMLSRQHSLDQSEFRKRDEATKKELKKTFIIYLY